jgi:hypothetical protein
MIQMAVAVVGGILDAVGRFKEKKEKGATPLDAVGRFNQREGRDAQIHSWSNHHVERFIQEMRDANEIQRERDLSEERRNNILLAMGQAVADSAMDLTRQWLAIQRERTILWRIFVFTNCLSVAMQLLTKNSLFTLAGFALDIPNLNYRSVFLYLTVDLLYMMSFFFLLRRAFGSSGDRMNRRCLITVISQALSPCICQLLLSTPNFLIYIVGCLLIGYLLQGIMIYSAPNGPSVFDFFINGFLIYVIHFPLCIFYYFLVS